MSHHNLKVLTLDDRMLTSELDKAGYRKIGIEIRSAANFQEAENILSKDEIDAIIVNDDYKEINGLAILKHYKSQQATKHIPIIFTSVRSKPLHHKELTKAGMDMFIEQPVPREYFVQQIRSLLDQKMRDNNRLGFTGNIEFTYHDQVKASTMQDISKTGLLLISDKHLDINTTISMKFVLPAYKKPIKVKGTIVREITKKKAEITEGFAYGVRFDKFEGDSQKRLDNYINKNDMDDPKLVYYL